MDSGATVRRFTAVAVALIVVTVGASVFFNPANGTIFTVSQSEDGNLTYITYNGDYGFDNYCRTGSSNLDEFYSYLSDHVTCGRTINGVNPVSCSTFVISQDDGSGYYAGRNFDFRHSTAGLVFTDPSGGYSSVSTVDLRMFGDTDEKFSDMAGDTRYNAVAYIPLDGINEKGVYICINAVIDAAAIDQTDAGKTNIFTTSALRVVLDHADSTESAVNLISQYNMHSSANYHFFICDDSGDSRAVDYVDSVMYVTETKLLTNHFLAEAGKDVPVAESSALRFSILSKALEDHSSMTEQQVRDTMESVMQNNPDHIHYSRWSVVYDLQNHTAGICLRVGEEFHWEKVYRYDLSGPTAC